MDKSRYALTLDMDEVMCSLISAVMDFCMKEWPDRQFRLPKYGRYNQWFTENFGTEGEDFERFKSVVFQDDFYLKLSPVLSSHHGHTVEQLSRMIWENFDHVSIATHRQGYMQNPREVTVEWLRNAGFLDVERLGVHVLSHSTCKLTTAKRSTIFVDDSISVAGAVTASRDHQMILVNHPWNDGYVRSSNCHITPSRRMIETIARVAHNL